MKLRYIRKLLNSLTLKNKGFNVYTILENETLSEARTKAKENGNTSLYYISVYPDNINHYKIQYLNSLDNIDELHERKSLNQILADREKEITDPEELKKWKHIK